MVTTSETGAVGSADEVAVALPAAVDSRVAVACDDGPALRAPGEHPPSRTTASRAAVQMVVRWITGSALRSGIPS